MGGEARTLSSNKIPAGNFEKPRIRELAEEFGLTKVAKKPDSYEICFVPDDDYRRFLKDRVDGLEEKVAGGKIVDQQGNVVGEHEGYPFYTIGQRRGLDIALGKPVYVTHINPETNVITIGEKKDLVSTTCRAKDINLSKYTQVPADEMEVTAAIRYNDDGVIGHLTQLNDDEIEVSFPTGREAIAPGQAVVCYEGNDVIAGGWIHKVNIDMNILQEA